nr:MAK10-like protein [Tanacetum cinerariifolium]
MGDENPIHTLEDYSKSSHEGYRNTIKLPVGNNVDLLQKFPHHGIDHWLQIQFFYDHVSFHLKCETDCVAGGKLCNKNTNESWEIIKNLALYDHEGWNDTKVFAKPVKAISTLQGTSKITDRRLLELEDQINFLLKGSRLVPMPSLTHTHQAYIKAVYSNSHPQNQNKPPKLNPFAFCKPHTGRMERFRNAIFKQREEINATGDDSKEIDGPDMKVSIKEAETKNETENEAKNKLIKKPEKEEVVEAPSSRPVGYYLMHRINEKLIEGLVDNNRFNDSLSGA